MKLLQNPPEAQIEKLLQRFTPRELAIGYLRAQRRAQDAEAETTAMRDMSAFGRQAFHADGAAAREAFGAAQRGFGPHGRGQA